MRNVSSGSIQIDEVDFFEFAARLWRFKFLIFSTMLLFFIGSVVYVANSSVRYEARAFLLPPSQSDIAEFNYGRTKDTELNKYSVKDVYEVFLNNLQAESLKRKFFEESYLPSLSESERKSPMDVLYADFSKTLVITRANKAGAERLVLLIRDDDPVIAKTWVERYLSQASAAAKAEMIKDVSQEADVRARNLAQKIETLREGGQQMRDDLIAQLREALSVAEAIGLKRPPLISGALSSEVSVGMTGELTYMRGSEALSAAIKELEERKSDDPFIKGLRDLQVDYSFYKKLEVRPDEVAVYRLDGPVELPDEPLGPKSYSVLAIGVFLGVVAGLLLASLCVVFHRRGNVK